MKHSKIILFVLGIIITTISCANKETSATTNPCIKGIFVGSYCDGYIIKILGQSNIGKSWESLYGTEKFENSIVASIDSIYVKTILKPEQFFSKDSIFYFHYRNGGYPRKQFNLCEPAPFITITSVSSSSCNMND